MLENEPPFRGVGGPQYRETVPLDWFDHHKELCSIHAQVLRKIKPGNISRSIIKTLLFFLGKIYKSCIY